MKAKGMAADTVMRGDMVAEDGEAKVDPGFGKFVPGTAYTG